MRKLFLRSLLFALLMAVGGVNAAWAGDTFEIIYGVPTYADDGETIIGVTPQDDFTGDANNVVYSKTIETKNPETGETVSTTTTNVNSDANGSNCTAAMPMEGSMLNLKANWSKNFASPVTFGKVYFSGNYTVSANNSYTIKIVDSNGYVIYQSSQQTTNGNANQNVATICGTAVSGYCRNARTCHYGVKLLVIDLDARKVSYELIVSSGDNNYSTQTGTVDIPEEVTDVKGMTVSKTTYDAYLDHVTFYSVQPAGYTVTTQYVDQNGMKLFEDAVNTVARGASFTPSYVASYSPGFYTYTYQQGGDEIASVEKDETITIVYTKTLKAAYAGYTLGGEGNAPFMVDYEGFGEAVGWTTATSGRFDPVILSDGDNHFLSVNQDQRNNNGTTLTNNLLKDKVEAGKDFTISFDLKIGNSSDQNPVEFAIFDQANKDTIFALTATGKNVTTWQVNRNAEQIVTLPGSGVNTIDKLTWYTVTVTRSGDVTYCTIADKATGKKILNKAVIAQLSETGGLGKMMFVTRRYNANLAMDNILVRDVVESEDIPAQATTYTVRYVTEDGTAIEGKADVVLDTYMGEEATAAEELLADFELNDKRYVYKEGNETITIVADAAQNVITLVFYEYGKLSYTVTTSYGETALPYTATGTVWEDNPTVKVSYPRYQLSGTQLVERLPNSNSLQAQITVDKDEYTTDLAYRTVDGKDNVYLLSEAEDLEGTGLSTSATTFTDRVSGGKIIHGGSANLLTLPAGTYTVTLGVIGGNGSSHKVNYVVYKGAKDDEGKVQIGTGQCTGNTLQFVTTDVFVLTEQTVISMTCSDAASDRGIDLVYVQQVDPNKGEHYIYSAADGKFIGRGADYGTRAIADNYGVPANVQKTNGNYTIQFLDNLLYLGSDGYADKAADYNNVAWAIEQTEGGFLLKNSNGSYATIEDGNVNINGTAANATVWTFKTAAEQQAIVAANQQANIVSVATAYGWDDVTTADEFTAKVATELIGNDQTALIKSATSGNTTDWAYTQTRAEGQWNGYNVGDYGAELYRRAGVVAQTIEVPEAGIYKLTLNALFRETDNGICREVGAKGYAMSNAFVSVNDTYYAQVPDWYSEADGTNPDNTGEAKTAFGQGKYAVTVWAYVGQDKQLTIKLNQPNWVHNGSWMLFNNFKLTYYAEPAGIAVESVTLDKTEATIALGDAPLALTATVTPDDADDKNVVWTSSNESVATVSEDGVVTAISAGTTVITATSSADDTKTATATITVTTAAAPAFYSEVAAGDFYIMNAATGKFLGGGNSWGTQASLIEHGIPFTAALSDGKYTLDSHTYNSAANHFFNGTYIDQPATALYVTPLGQGRYSISTADGSAYATAVAGKNTIENTADNAGSLLAQWYFLSKADRDKMLTAATATTPADATYYIKEANYSRNLLGQETGGWTGDMTRGQDTDLGRTNYIAERYHAKTDVYQIINDLPNGTYTVRVQGFSDDATFYANDQEVKLVKVNEAGYSPVPNSMETAGKAFLEGYYENELTVTVTDRTLKLGIKSDNTNVWTTWDNFELFMTEYSPVTDITATISTSEMEVTQTAVITAETNPALASFNKLTYTSSNEEVATVSAEGVVTGVAEGTATITVSAEMEAVTKTFDVTILAPAVLPETIAIAVGEESVEELTVFINKTAKLVASVQPEEASQVVSFASDNEEVLTVSADGVVTPVSYGTANITVTSDAKSDVKTVLPVVVTAALYNELDNLDFAEGPVIDNHICTYEKDIVDNNTTYAQMQPVSGWQMGVANSDARAAGVMAYGSSAGMGSNNASFYAPATNPDGAAEGNALGMVGVWTGTVQYVQPVKLAAGEYTITVPVYRNGGGNALTKNLIGVILDNGTEYLAATKTYADKTWTEEVVKFNIDEDTYGKLSLGLEAPNAGSADCQRLWIDRVSISFTSLSDLKNNIISAIAATEIPTGAMNSGVQDALAEAKTDADAGTAENTLEELTALQTALNTAIENANNSIAAYTKAAQAVSDANDLKEAHNFASAEATETFAAAIAAVKEAYDARSLSDADANNAGLTLGVAVSGWRANANGAAVKYLNDGFSLNDFAAALYVNTWSTEGANDGSNFVVPFYEYYTGDANSLGEHTWTGTLTGLENGEYVVSATVRARMKNAEEEEVSQSVGLTFDVNGADAIDFADNNLLVDGTRFRMATCAAKGLVKDGTLKFNINVAAENNVSWLSFKNVTYKKLRDLTADELAVAPTAITLLVDEEEVTEVALNKAATTVTLTPSYTPANASEGYLAWTSSDNNIATVVNGVVTGMSTGQATITATSTLDETVSASVTVVVTYPETELAAATYKNEDAVRTIYTWGDNLVKNGSFEYPDGFFGWTNGAGGALAAANFNIVADGDNHYLQAKNSKGVADANSISTAWEVEQGKTYLFGYKTKASKAGNSEYHVVSLTNTVGTETAALNTADERKAISVGTSWTEVKYEFTNTEGYKYLQFCARWLGNSASFDDFYLAEVTTVTEGNVDYATAAVPTANIGTGAFQYSQEAIDAVNALVQGTATVDDVQEAYDAVTTLNAPEDGQLFNVVNITSGYAHSGNALTFSSAKGANLNANTTSMQWLEAPGSIHPQAVKFTAVDGVKNGYTMSYTRADGNEVFVSTGSRSGYGNNTQQIRPTTDVAKALVVEVRSTADNSWKLYNTENKNNIGATNDTGFYTNGGGNSDVKIQEAVNSEVSLNILAANQYGTIMLPFDADVPADVVAYSISEVSGSTVTLVTETSLQSNTPYVLFAENGAEVTFQGLGAAYNDATLTEGLLTGTFKTMAAVDGTYILQNQDGKVGFYQVDTTVAKPNVPAFRAYLTAPASSRRAFFFGDNETTGIRALDALSSGDAAIYDANGVQQQRLVKGLNIILTKDGKTHKVLVK